MQPYLPEVSELEVIGTHALRITFDTGVVRDIDVTRALFTILNKGVFIPLQDPAFFAQAYIENGTVSWPNGADIAPESLYTDQF
jgi:hypothetical protein